jgi:hypothetical protein
MPRLEDKMLEKPFYDPLAAHNEATATWDEVEDMLDDGELAGHVHTFLNGVCSAEELGEALESLHNEIRRRRGKGAA